jgi:hypothetical protein
MHTRFKLHASSRVAKLASMERYRRERLSLEVNPGGPYYSLPKQSIPTPVQPRVSLLDATPEQLTFVEAELARFVGTGAWERTTWSKYISTLFLVAKPSNNQW